jgi:hypothetical protein
MSTLVSDTFVALWDFTKSVLRRASEAGSISSVSRVGNRLIVAVPVILRLENGEIYQTEIVSTLMADDETVTEMLTVFEMAKEALSNREDFFSGYPLSNTDEG